MIRGNNNNKMDDRAGALDVSILSVYDLRDREEPSCVSVEACGVTVTSGPPSSRHKDRNSFKFSNDELVICKPLKELCRSTLTVKIVYANRPFLKLKADYDLSQLRIRENAWLILNLETESGTNGDNEVAPTIRIKVQLRGPYRPEWAAFVATCRLWFSLVDRVEAGSQQMASMLPGVPAIPSLSGPMLLLPAIPIILLLVLLAPILLVSLPIVLPVLLVLYSSTQGGRKFMYEAAEPLILMVVTSPASQTLIYDIGPRPTPVRLIRLVVPTTIWNKLLMSLGIDLIGNFSYLLPGVGEVVIDIPWATIQTMFITAMYEDVSPNLKYVSFVEEILPFTDIVPSATIGWVSEFGPQILAGNVQGTEASAAAQALRVIQKYTPEETSKNK